MAGTISEFDVEMMRRAIRLAMNGRGSVEPNPMVGCVLARDRHVIGEGFHARFGGPHAEPTALANCTDSPAGATAYVTLEPCCHLDKKTPPCVPKLIEAKIARIVVGCVDPNPQVNGRGLDLLRQAGIRVDANVLEDPAKQLLAPFIATAVYDRPYITLKWAETADGKIAGPRGARLAISNPAMTRLVHELRARSDAIMVGINTVLSDDPLLTARDVPAARPLTRVVLDSQLRIPTSARLLADRSARTVLYTDADTFIRSDRVRELQRSGVEIWPGQRDHGGRLNLLNLLVHNKDWTPQHLLVEPGPTLARSFLAAHRPDRLWVIRSPRRIDDPTAPAAVGVPGDLVKTGQLRLDGDVLDEYLNPDSPVFFAPEPSADFVLACETSR